MLQPAVLPAGAFPAPPPTSVDNVGAEETDATVYLPVEKLRRQFTDFTGSKAAEIEERRLSSRYYHGAQWSAEDAAVLRKRRQPIITDNLINRKINGIVGLAERQRQDPKAYPRGPQNEQGAEVATTVVREITDASEWKTLKPSCLLQAAIDGVAGVELQLIKGDKGDPDIKLVPIDGDTFFYDPKSSRLDFSDARFMGVSKWMDLDEAISLVPEKEEELRSLVENGSDLTIASDKDRRLMFVSGDRLRMVEHWYRHRGAWCYALYVATTLLEEGTSPFYDERGQSISRYVMFSAAVDHDGDRYGFVRALRGLQDEVNQRRSKALFQSNSRRLIAEKGAVDDVETTRSEWARADGYIEVNPGKKIDPDNTTADLAAQFQLMEQARNSIEAFANVNPAAFAGAGVKNLSGRAVNMLQQPGLAELGPFLIAYRGWCIRVYRALWNAAQRVWKSERWIRVTQDQDVAQFLQINSMELDQWGRPVLVNHLGALDVDIILDEGPDVVSSMADAFDVLSQMPAGSVPPDFLIEAMPIPGSLKDKWLKKLQAPPDPMKVQAAQIELQKGHAQVGKIQADTLKSRAGAISSIASAAHKAHEAHLSSQEFARDGFQDSAEAPGAPIGPDPASAPPAVPMTRLQIPGAAPLPSNAPIAAGLLQNIPQPVGLPQPPAQPVAGPVPRARLPNPYPRAYRGAQRPLPGAQPAGDGTWIVPHAFGPGKHARVGVR